MSAAPTAPTTTVNLPKNLLAPPTFFDGAEETYPAWKRQVQLFVLANSTHYPDDASKQMTALSYMRDKKAFRWATSTCGKWAIALHGRYESLMFSPSLIHK